MVDRGLGARQRGFLRGTVRRATREFWDFGDEHLMLMAPADSDLAFGHLLRDALAASFKPSEPPAVRV